MQVTLSSTTISLSKLPSFGTYLDRSITFTATSSPVGMCFPFRTIENPGIKQANSNVNNIYPCKFDDVVSLQCHYSQTVIWYTTFEIFIVCNFLLLLFFCCLDLKWGQFHKQKRRTLYYGSSTSWNTLKIFEKRVHLQNLWFSPLCTASGTHLQRLSENEGFV